MNSIIRSPLAIGAIVAVLVIVIGVAIAMGRRGSTPREGDTVKVDIDKLRQQIRTEGVGRR